MTDVPPRVLTIAGSDSSGGAGIQADLKTFAMHRVWGASAVTALTAQNLSGVRSVWMPPSDFVVEQIEAVLDEAPIQAAKTGMLGNGAIVQALCDLLDRRPIPNLVVDPVLVATSGALLFESRDIDLYRNELIPRAALVTPNLAEAEALTGERLTSVENMERAARRLVRMGARAVLIKGGHLENPPDKAVDLFLNVSECHLLESPRFEGRCTHGTGCTLSAAIASNLALGRTLRESVEAGKRYTADCIEHAFHEGGAAGLNAYHQRG